MNRRTSFYPNAEASPNTPTTSDVLTFRAQTECVRCGGNINNHDDMLAATARVLKADPKLADAYYDDPREPYVEGQR